MALTKNIIAKLNKHYEGATIIIESSATHALVADIEDGEAYTVSVYQTDDYTGTKGGYIGRSLFSMQRHNMSNDEFRAIALTTFAAYK